MAFALAMGIISHCYYDNGVISKKFEFVLRYILGTRNLLRNQIKADSTPIGSQKRDESASGSNSAKCGTEETIKVVEVGEITENAPVSH